MAQLLYATPEGRLRVHPRLRTLARSGAEDVLPDRLIPLPPGSTLAYLPGRFALGQGATGEVVSLAQDGCLAAAAVLPPGYLRTWLPAYEAEPDARVLPLFAYAAVGSVGGQPHVAAMRTDRWEAWNTLAPTRSRIRLQIRGLKRRLPRNRLVAHLVTCATDYRCLTAQNLFLRRGEAAIPVSPACNAACLGCISEQWGEVESPQTRLSFAPSTVEIAELALWHLSAGRSNFVSFGQGCEGEPLTRGQTLVEAVRAIRAAAPRATIHINTNGSRPDVMRRLIEAGLNSARISIFSLDEQRFRAYYRPVGYGLQEISACADLLRDAGGQVSLNLLTFPGITDAPAEMDALLAFIQDHGVQQVQLRSLNVDPGWLLARIPPPGRGLGMRTFVRTLRSLRPDLRLGNFTRPWPPLPPSAALRARREAALSP